MNPNHAAAFKVLEETQQTLKSGDKIAARQLALKAVRLAPELEEVWLLMAALANPQDSVVHLQKALQINPQSERALKGMAWARKRLAQTVQAGVVAANNLPGTQPAEFPGSITQPRNVTPAVPVVVPSIPGGKSQNTPNKKVALRLLQYIYLALLSVLIGLVIFWLVWQGVQPAAAIGSSAFTGREHGPAWAQVNIVKPASALDSSGAATISAVVTNIAPNNDPTIMTEKPVSAAIDLPSVTPVPLLTSPTALTPTASSLPTTTSTPITVAELETATLEVAEGASPTPLPTDTSVPFATPILPANRVVSAVSSGRWIDVDLTNQMAYAYEDDTVVNSFLVSTGTSKTPTVTGRYRIYIKYHHADMSGPGYYLPDVPFIMYFFEGYGFHGTYWHNNFGTPMSRGCVNLRIPDSEWLFNFASVGTLVNIHY